MSKISRLEVVLLCLVAFTLPGPVRVNNVFVAFLIARWIIEAIVKRPSVSFLKNPIFIVGASFFLIHLLGLLYSENVKSGIAYLERIHTFITFGIVLSNCRNVDSMGRKTIRKNVLLSFVAGVAIISILYQWNIDNAIDRLLTINRTYVGLYQLIALVIISYFITAADHTRKMKLMLGFLGCVIAFLMIKNGAKASVFLFPLVLVSSIVHYFLISKNFVKPIVAGLLAIIAFIVFLNVSPFTMSRIERLFRDGTDDIRVRNWETALGLIKNNAILGVGTGDSLDELQRARENWWQEYLDEYNCHNQYLETQLRVGLVGLLFLIAWYFIAIVYAWQARDLVLIVFVLVFALSCMTESLLVRQKGVVLCSFFFYFLSYTNSSMLRKQTRSGYHESN